MHAFVRTLRAVELRLCEQHSFERNFSQIWINSRWLDLDGNVNKKIVLIKMFI